MRIACCFALAVVGACGDDDTIDSDEEARRAYLGLDQSIEASIALGFDGFNAASSANIDAQATTGLATGTLTITGQVDQGASDNKGMRLLVAMDEYSDGPFLVQYDDEELEVSLTYATDAAALPALDMQLKSIPDGTLDGTLRGTYLMTGDIEGEATLDLTFSGALQPVVGSDDVERVPGTTTVTGTVTAGDGAYVVDITI
jgi:hypothetical protein